MSTVKEFNKSTLNFQNLPLIIKVEIDSVNELISFYLDDKRIISVPIVKFHSLKNANKNQLLNFNIQGHFVFWDEVDEIVGVKNLLDGSVTRS